MDDTTHEPQVGGTRWGYCAGPQRDPSLWLQVSVTALEAKASLNPGAVSGHIGVDAWTVGQGTALAPAHHAHQNPAPSSHAGQGSPRVTLQEKGKLRSQPFEDVGGQSQGSSPRGAASGLGARMDDPSVLGSREGGREGARHRT